MKLVHVSGPASEPVTLAEAAGHLRVDYSDDDALIHAQVVAAREWAEAFTRRAFGTQTFDLFFDGWPRFPLELPRAPLQSVTGIFYVDDDGVETEWDDDNYLVDTAAEPGRVVLKRGAAFPNVILQETNGVRVRFIAGHVETPEMVKAAMLLLVGDLYENRENTAVATGVAVHRLPFGVRELLWPLRVL